MSSACGSAVEFVAEETNSWTVCNGHFANTAGDSGPELTIEYFDVPGTTPADELAQCTDTNEMSPYKGYKGTPEFVAGKKGCLYDDGNQLQFAGKKHVIHISSSFIADNKGACTPAQLKALADILAKKLG